MKDRVKSHPVSRWSTQPTNQSQSRPRHVAEKSGIAAKSFRANNLVKNRDPLLLARHVLNDTRRVIDH